MRGVMFVGTHFVMPDTATAEAGDCLAALRKSYPGPAIIANDLDRF